MISKLVATSVLAGGLTLGIGGVASAAAPTAGSATTPHHLTCAGAPKLEARIQSLEAKGQAWLPKAEARLAVAQKDNDQTKAAKIQKRITRVQHLLAQATTWLSKIEAKCPAPTGSSSPGATQSS
jgi:hypothetical protein